MTAVNIYLNEWSILLSSQGLYFTSFYLNCLTASFIASNLNRWVKPIWIIWGNHNKVNQTLSLVGPGCISGCRKESNSCGCTKTKQISITQTVICAQLQAFFLKIWVKHCQDLLITTSSRKQEELLLYSGLSRIYSLRVKPIRCLYKIKTSS